VIVVSLPGTRLEVGVLVIGCAVLLTVELDDRGVWVRRRCQGRWPAWTEYLARTMVFSCFSHWESSRCRGPEHRPWATSCRPGTVGDFYRAGPTVHLGGGSRKSRPEVHRAAPRRPLAPLVAGRSNMDHALSILRGYARAIKPLQFLAAQRAGCRELTIALLVTRPATG